MREGMVRRRGLMSGGERLLVDLPENGGPYARRIATDALLRESEPHE